MFMIQFFGNILGIRYRWGFEDMSRVCGMEPLSASLSQVSLGFPAFSDVSSKAAAKVKINF